VSQGRNYFLPFFVVFLDEDFLVVDFLEPFLAAMALVTSFLSRNVKVEEFLVNVFLLASDFFSAHRAARFRARTPRRARRRHARGRALARLSA
jgi:hypothetical protein